MRQKRMKWFIWVGIAALLLSGCSESNGTIESGNSASNQISQPSEKKENNQELSPHLIPAEIVRVVDGDTMKVAVAGREETLRLLLVDTPESVHPDKPVQPFGPEASQFAKNTLPEGKQVQIELDVSERDKYGRLLCYLWVDGKMFNQMLLEQGLARVAYVIPPNVKYVDLFREIEKQAQLKGIGIWSIENYAREDGFYPEAAASQPSSKGDDSIIERNGPGPHGEWIKGNINRKGEKIYHVPGGQFYDQTIPEEWFFTEEEAEAAGFRPSKK